MEINDLLTNFDFTEYDYYYHITSLDVAPIICEEGLNIRGTNLISEALNIRSGINEILLSTTIKITEEMIENENIFLDEGRNNNFRNGNAMIIICTLKDSSVLISNNYDDDFKYKIPPEYIMGYVDLDNREFVNNDYYFEGLYHENRSY